MAAIGKTPTRSVMDERVHALLILIDACGRLPGYSLGEILYTGLRTAASMEGGDVRFLRKMDNKRLVGLIDRCVSSEFDNGE